MMSSSRINRSRLDDDGLVRLRAERGAVADGGGVFQSACRSVEARAISAFTKPADRVHPEVVTAMREEGMDLADATPQRLTPDLAAQAQVLVTMGCGDECPYVPGAQVEDWPLDDPHGKVADQVTQIRDQVRDRVRALVRDRGWAR
jgi:arsenate reductase (thioredoxin)